MSGKTSRRREAGRGSAGGGGWVPVPEHPRCWCRSPTLIDGLKGHGVPTHTL